MVFAGRRVGVYGRVKGVFHQSSSAAKFDEHPATGHRAHLEPMQREPSGQLLNAGTSSAEFFGELCRSEPGVEIRRRFLVLLSHQGIERGLRHRIALQHRPHTLHGEAGINFPAIICGSSWRVPVATKHHAPRFIHCPDAARAACGLLAIQRVRQNPREDEGSEAVKAKDKRTGHNIFWPDLETR